MGNSLINSTTYLNSNINLVLLITKPVLACILTFNQLNILNTHFKFQIQIYPNVQNKTCNLFKFNFNIF